MFYIIFSVDLITEIAFNIIFRNIGFIKKSGKWGYLKTEEQVRATGGITPSWTFPEQCFTITLGVPHLKQNVFQEEDKKFLNACADTPWAFQLTFWQLEQSKRCPNLVKPNVGGSQPNLTKGWSVLPILT